MATIKDIAEACQVSKATVSRYINGSGYVSAEVAKRLAAKIEEVNYVPSATARNLSTRKSKVIAVVIPEVSNPFFAEVFKGISQVAEQNDLSIFYCDTDNDADKELKALSMLRGYELQGLILTPAVGDIEDQSYNQTFMASVASLNVPVVLLDRDLTYGDWDGVFINNYKGAYELTSCLIEAGHTKIATITGDRKLMIGSERHRGYEEAMKDRGLAVDPSTVMEGDFSTETAYQAMKVLLEDHKEVTAVFSTNNLTSLGILKAVNEKGLRIPQHMALVAFDDIEILDILNFNLTVLKRDNIAMGQEAMKLLMKKIHQPDIIDASRLVLEPEIIIRGSEKKVN